MQGKLHERSGSVPARFLDVQFQHPGAVDLVHPAQYHPMASAMSPLALPQNVAAAQHLLHVGGLDLGQPPASPQSGAPRSPRSAVPAFSRVSSMRSTALGSRSGSLPAPGMPLRQAVTRSAASRIISSSPSSIRSRRTEGPVLSQPGDFFLIGHWHSSLSACVRLLFQKTLLVSFHLNLTTVSCQYKKRDCRKAVPL